MAEVYDATMAGRRARTRPRQVIWDSWQRLMKKGLRPDRQTPPVADASTVKMLRQESGLMSVVELVSHGLGSMISSGENILAIADAQCTVLWRQGPPKVLASADRLGFVEGARWSEIAVGTNALGTALVSQRAVQTFCAEHYNRNQHPWTCAGAPIRNSRSNKVIGVIDVTGPAATVHPATVALIDAVARLAECHLREQHDNSMNRLRAVAAPIIARVGAPALAVDTDGWVAAVDSIPVQKRILLPAELAPGSAWVPEVGLCEVEPLPGGWLVRPVDDGVEPTIAKVTLDLRDSAVPVLEMHGDFGTWRHDISLRHAEILLILSSQPRGRSAPELAADLYGDRARVGAVRVEMSRLRKQIVGIVANRPYRFVDRIPVEVRRPANPMELLPGSQSPAIRALRHSSGSNQTTAH
ncbi:diguanylate cyclase [Mycolicibacterium agri]|uniref:Diguanylate cyclase n=2 Tax=Mycolicibacterium agri TaxID=36811 RepID=A0A2A7MV02_MYCAG|nr:GAF domain-containing protein [Mycolicibacterium agri]PEG35379.1 diguanylate cyclase [Mycolicibacterium agri]GFG53515.1 hypothetical protein MAGR_49560 [Mycolicibacterium agri]